MRQSKGHCMLGWTNPCVTGNTSDHLASWEVNGPCPRRFSGLSTVPQNLPLPYWEYFCQQVLPAVEFLYYCFHALWELYNIIQRFMNKGWEWLQVTVLSEGGLPWYWLFLRHKHCSSMLNQPTEYTPPHFQFAGSRGSSGWISGSPSVCWTNTTCSLLFKGHVFGACHNTVASFSWR